MRDDQLTAIIAKAGKLTTDEQRIEFANSIEARADLELWPRTVAAAWIRRLKGDASKFPPTFVRILNGT